ncbi:MAG: RNA polymerase sigma factor [Bacteroidales bacterium]|jgi:RNA polymerase sigma-70 factor (ECF subfamily)|nr:RNA polymerase sigma factor [Bacteroidales bacterium]MDD3735938.1 RNA polymerase sigma factor [Bacteroidales bacterium]NLD64308.1 RNA polymerase sigma factor [Bacteroidales bacterium]HNT92757.1 RNA polymerase sigma factor [Bacteroidales bacterium]HOO66295.1 RNA polymerase sigma factor [Bacteroidales bacterium]
MTPEEFRKEILPEGRRLYAFAYRFLNNREEAEDAVQEVMMKLWSRRNDKSRYASTAAWCTTVTRNYCIDILRRKNRLRLESLSEAAGVSAAQRGDEGTGDEREAAGVVSAIVRRMKEPGRSAIILRDMEGYSYEEAAEAMGTNVAALRTLISRARKQIREEMNRIYNYGTGEDNRTDKQVF